MEERLQRAQLWFFRTWSAIGVLLLLVAAWYALREPIAIIGPPLALAVVIVYLLNPIVRWLAARGVARPLGTAFAYLVLLAAVVFGLRALAPVLGEQIGQLADDAPDIAVRVERNVNAQLDRFGIDQEVSLDPQSDEVRDAVRRYLGGGSADLLTGVLTSAGDLVVSVFHIGVIVLLGPVLAFYLLADLPRVVAGLKRLVPPDRRETVEELTQGVLARVGGYFRGQLLVAAFVGIATSLGLLLVGLPYWALVGLITGVFNLVPLIGPFVGGAIGVIIALTVGDGVGQAIAVAVVMTVVQQVDNHVISPNVMSRTVELHPVTVMLGLLVAGSLYGILGMLVAVPTIAAVKLISLHLLSRRAPWTLPERT